MADAKQQDPRWGGYVPWFFRSTELGQGDFHLFFERVAHRVDRLFRFNEAGIPNMHHFGAVLETATHQHFRYNRQTTTLHEQLHAYFSPQTLDYQATLRVNSDPAAAIQQIHEQLRESDKEKKLREAQALHKATRERLREKHFRDLASVRFGVLEVLLRVLPMDKAWVQNFRQDIRAFFAETGLSMDIRGVPPLIVPLDEPLLQKEIIDTLLPRLTAAGFGKEAAEIVKAYHDHLNGVDTNKVFGNAFKALEAIARQLTGDGQLMLNKEAELQTHFPEFHATIRKTITNLANHRGDEGGHGGKGPDAHEMRYLLFAICNTALLVLDYPKPS